MISYQSELLATCRDEIETLLPLHYDEIAVNKDVIPLDCNWAAYEKKERDGELHIITVRLDGRLIGYHVSFVTPHLHYKSTLMAFVDVYFLLKEHRRGRIGLGLFQEVEKSLKARGVVKVFSGTKLHSDISPLFERLGWHATETLFTKVL